MTSGNREISESVALGVGLRPWEREGGSRKRRFYHEWWRRCFPSRRPLRASVRSTTLPVQDTELLLEMIPATRVCGFCGIWRFLDEVANVAELEVRELFSPAGF